MEQLEHKLVSTSNVVLPEVLFCHKRNPLLMLVCRQHHTSSLCRDSAQAYWGCVSRPSLCTMQVVSGAATPGPGSPLQLQPKVTGLSAAL